MYNMPNVSYIFLTAYTKRICLNSFHDGGPNHIETSLLTMRLSQI